MMRTLLAAGLLLFATSLLAQTTPRPGRLSKEETAALRPGLQLQFIAGPFGNSGDACVIRAAALHVPRGTSPSPFVPPGRIAVVVSGYLKVPLKGTHDYHIYATGPLRFTINDEEVYKYEGHEATTASVKGVALVKGYNKIRIMLEASAERDAGFRIDWSGEDFAREPLPPDALFTPGDDAPLVKGLAQREGRELFATQGCAMCHTLGERIPLEPREGAMPELAWEAPSLAAAGSRFNEAWLREWIREPQKLRPTATMPHVLQGDAATQTQAAADIAAYLVKLEPSESPDEDPTDERVAAGMKLFEDLGCIACHSTKPPGEEDPFARVSLHYANAKFVSGALATFLQHPHEHYAWSRMPDFKLSDDEARAIATFLQVRAKGELAAVDRPAGDAARGKALFASSGCANCHALEGSAPLAKTPIEPAAIANGCLAEARSDKAPHFAFTPEERQALADFLETDRASLLRETPAEFSQRQVKTLNCVACHRRDGANSVLPMVLQEEGEQGLTPEVLPLLTWTGEKLKPAWAEKFIAGESDQRARPWLRARMPAFPARAKLLAVGLSHEHGFAVDENPAPKHDAALAKVGQQLVGDVGGFSCIKCHAIGKRPPLAPFEAPGINLVSAAERLRYSYYPRWMLDPPRVDVLTKMPKFAADSKTTGLANVFDGHAGKQYEALWHYIQTLPQTER